MSEELKAEFESAATEVNALTKKPTNDELLTLYGLYKQAKFGDNTTEKPGFFDPKGRAKWDAWDKLKGTSDVDAMTEYIKLVKSLKEKYA